MLRGILTWTTLTGIYDYATDGENVWHFGNARQRPVLETGLNGDGVATWEEFGSQRRAR